MKNKWLKKEGESVVRLVSEVTDETAAMLRAIQASVHSSLPLTVPGSITNTANRRHI